MRILIIDDEESSRFLLTSILEAYQCYVVEAVDCFEGFEVLKSDPNFDLALVDWCTPRMNGIEFVQKVRSDPHLEKLALIMTTGMNDMDNIKQALEVGVNEYVMKPFTEDMIVEKINMIGLDLSELNEAQLSN